MTTSIERLRAVADFAEKHDLAGPLSSANVHFDCKVQLYGAGDEIAALIPWAEALGETVIWIRDVKPDFHLYVRGELPGLDGPFTVVAVTEGVETQAIVDAAMFRASSDLPVALAVMRRLARSGKDTPK
jgi:hypothetical protein